jgi:hypothetical protein
MMSAEESPRRPAPLDALDQLVATASAVAANWAVPSFRHRAGQEARAIHLPRPEIIARNKFLTAIALRSALAAISRAESDDGREHLAAALAALVAAVRAELRKPISARLVEPGRLYWMKD